jgi:hypothetical protein
MAGNTYNYGSLCFHYTITNNTNAPLVVNSVIIAPLNSEAVFISQDDLNVLSSMGSAVSLVQMGSVTPTVSG